MWTTVAATLGISSHYHDSAVAIVVGGQPVWALQEERLSRVKNDPRFPVLALAEAEQFCRSSGLEISHIAYYEKPLLKFERILTWMHDMAPASWPVFRDAIPQWISDKAWIRSKIHKATRKWLGSVPVSFLPHHLSHAASSFFTSGWETAAILTIDGVGEWSTSTISHGRGSHIEMLQETRFPHSLGLLYSAVTAYCGFAVNEGEYKVMGLSAFARNHPGTTELYQKLLGEAVQILPSGAVFLHPDYFDFLRRSRMFNPKRWRKLLGFGPRTSNGDIGPEYAFLAAAVQKITEDAVSRMARQAILLTGERRVCLAGGVALNCVANSQLLDAKVVDEIWIPSAAGDAGAAMGAALFIDAQSNPTSRRHTYSPYLGPAYTDDAFRQSISAAGHVAIRVDDDELFEQVAAALAANALVAWVQGRSEFGPRALGNRSLLADPRIPDNLRRINLAIKKREPFRPFAPAVLAAEASQWFGPITANPTNRATELMLLTDQTTPSDNGSAAAYPQELSALHGPPVKSYLPAVTHIDGSARVQTVTPSSNPRFANLLEVFGKRTGCPVLLNTSLNQAGEPIVETAEDAIRFFDNHAVDILVIGNYVLRKSNRNA